MARAKPYVYVTRNLFGKWVVRLTGQYDTQLAAELVGRSIAGILNTQFEVRDRFGRIRKADSSGDANDPRDIPG
jgi:hypothetical protein